VEVVVALEVLVAVVVLEDVLVVEEVIVVVEVGVQYPHVKSQPPNPTHVGQKYSSQRLSDGGLHVSHLLLASAQNSVPKALTL